MTAVYDIYSVGDLNWEKRVQTSTHLISGGFTIETTMQGNNMRMLALMLTSKPVRGHLEHRLSIDMAFEAVTFHSENLFSDQCSRVKQ